MAKNVGLCVCYDTKNFGSQLQVLATQQMVERLGYDYEIILYKKILTPAFVLQSLPRLLNFYFVKGKLEKFKKRRTIAKHPEIQKQVSVRNKRFGKFVKEYFPKFSETYKGFSALKKGAYKYDAVLTGSDQLWLPNNLGSHFFTQEFVPDHINKVAYAPSFGVNQIPWYQKKRTAKYLRRFNALSCREIRGTQIIKELTGIDALTVCDPTMLLTYDEWLSVIPDNKVVEEPYIFAYFLGENEEQRKQAEALSRKTGLPIVSTPFCNHFVEYDKNFGDKQIYDMDSADFVNLIRNAEYVCTDSFHGSVFSILNHTKFITFSRFADESKTSKNSRIESLFDLTGLKDRHCTGNILDMYDKDIDFEEVDKKVDIVRQKSINYLENALKNS